jgi:hypothetical protein
VDGVVYRVEALAFVEKLRRFRLASTRIEEFIDAVMADRDCTNARASRVSFARTDTRGTKPGSTGVVGRDVHRPFEGPRAPKTRKALPWK